MSPTKAHQSLPLFKFPSEIVLVDDSIHYIKALKIMAASQGVELTCFNDPKKALQYLHSHNYCQFIKEAMPVKFNTDIFHDKVELCLNNLHREVYNPVRFSELSLLVIDYAMPGMNGQEFCEQVNNLPIEKLLLTGEASFEKAVEMFNAELIDKFIKKNEDFSEIFSIFQDMQHKYFQKISKPLLGLLQNSRGATAFFDEKFIEFFHNVLEKNQIIEYYAADNCGSYLLVNQAGVSKLLVVKSEHDMQALYNMAEDDGDVTGEILEMLRKRQKIAFFQGEKEMEAPVTLWYFHDAQVMEGSLQKYYYALIPIGADFKLHQGKVSSYQKYLSAEDNQRQSA